MSNVPISYWHLPANKLSDIAKRMSSIAALIFCPFFSGTVTIFDYLSKLRTGFGLELGMNKSLHQQMLFTLLSSNVPLSKFRKVCQTK